MARLTNRVALITGAASGIGAACARRFAEEGASVVGCDLNASPEPDWLECQRLAPNSVLLAGDVRGESDVAAAIADARARFGRIDIVVNSAGIAGGGMVHQLAPEEFRRVLDVNLYGTFLVCREVLPLMIEQGSGNIINLASVEGIEGFEGGSAYNASKGGVVLLTKNLAIDYARKGIRANAICPGFIQTPLLAMLMENELLAEVRERIRDAHHLGRFGQPIDIANAALFLASDESSFITGHSLVVDGGYTAGHRFGIGKLMGFE